MTRPAAARAFLVSEVETLEPFGFVGVLPSGRLLSMVEITRREDGELEVRVPGRPHAVPALEARVRGALVERDFESKDPSDSTQAWVRSVENADAAVALAQELLVEVFGEKPDATIDVGHGSHQAEHEATKKLGVARTRVEAIVSEMLGSKAEQDSDGDYVLPIGNVHVMIGPRAGLDGQIVIRVFAITNVGVGVSSELGLFLARLNFGLMFGRFALDAANQSIWFDETLLGESFREEELQYAVRIVASTADEWDDRLKQMFGGATYQETLAGRSAEARPPLKPGEGVGQYI